MSSELLPMLYKLKDTDDIDAKFLQKVIYEVKNHQTYSTEVEIFIQEILEKNKILKLFEGVYGIGPVKALQFYNWGARTLDDLSNYNLTNSQKIGIKYYDDINSRIPRAEIDLYAEYFQKIFKDIEWEIAGSYRRGAQTSGDIDVLIKNPGDLNISQLITKLKNNNILKEILMYSKEENKCYGMARLPYFNDDGENYPFRRLDLLIMNPDEYALGLFYFTGSQHHNIYVRSMAKRQNLTLSSNSLIDLETNEKILGLNSEKEIYDYLKIPYMTPEERNFDAKKLKELLDS